jgi:hypothetical protein
LGESEEHFQTSDPGGGNEKFCEEPEASRQGRGSEGSLAELLTMDNRGVAGLVRLAILIEDRLQVDTFSLGTNPLLPDADCLGEFHGKLLCYVVGVGEERIHLLICPMDTGDELESFLTVPDTPENWLVAFRFIRACEWSGLATLQPRPLSLGPPAGGPDSFVLA